MKLTKKLVLAAALTGLVGGTVTRANAQDNPPKKADKKDKVEKHACKGQNSCKGKGGCGTTKGKNDCKGKGECRTDGKPMAKS